MDKIDSIHIKDYRSLKNIKISDIGNLWVLVGKNDVGKTSVLEALNYLVYNEHPQFSLSRYVDGFVELKCSNGDTYSRYNGIGVPRPINYYLFSVDNEFERNGKDTTIKQLIREKYNRTVIHKEDSDITMLKSRVADVVNIYAIVKGLNDFFYQNVSIKRIFDSAFYNRGFCDIQKILVKKDFILSYLNSHSVSTFDRNQFQKLFRIINKFEVNKEVVMSMAEQYGGETKKKVSEFFETGDSSCVLDLFVDDSSEWLDFIHQINRSYYHGRLEVNVGDYFFANQFKILSNGFTISEFCHHMYSSNKTPKQVKFFLDKELDEYISRKKDRTIIKLWEDFLLQFDNGRPICQRGWGIRRLCRLFEYFIDEYYDRGDSTIPTVFAIDEVENSLHPSQQRSLINILKAMSDKFQFIITTHSPYVINELDNNKVSILTKNKRGKTVVKSLSHHFINYPSLAEINYMAFDEPSIEYHQELYGQIELEWFGESNGNKIDDIIDILYGCNIDNCVLKELVNEYNKGLDNPFYISYKKDNKRISPDKSDSQGHYVPFCVRNSIDHPCEENAKWTRSNVVLLSIKILLEVAKKIKKAKAFFVKMTKKQNLDEPKYQQNKYKLFACSGCSDMNCHTVVYWVDYAYKHPNELIFKDNNTKHKLSNFCYLFEAIKTIDSNWIKNN